jgi:glutamine amidotransferase
MTIESADRIILPGVGAFGDAMDKLLDTGLVPMLEGQVRSGKPFLGICLGMQLLFEHSFEYGLHNGLGYIKRGRLPACGDFNKAGIKLKVPQMGWNS